MFGRKESKDLCEKIETCKLYMQVETGNFTCKSKSLTNFCDFRNQKSVFLLMIDSDDWNV
jgi:hypothetical protein